MIRFAKRCSHGWLGVERGVQRGLCNLPRGMVYNIHWNIARLSLRCNLANELDKAEK